MIRDLTDHVREKDEAEGPDEIVEENKRLRNAVGALHWHIEDVLNVGQNHSDKMFKSHFSSLVSLSRRMRKDDPAQREWEDVK